MAAPSERVPPPFRPPVSLAVRRLRYRLGVLALALLTACGGCHKTDAERAAEERAEIEERIRDSNTLVPYRALKLTARAQGTGKEPEAVTALWALLEETRALPDRELTKEEARRAAETYLRLAIGFYKTKQTLREHDEDDYPLLWARLERGERPPELLFPGYDNGMEHLFVGSVLVLLDTADRGNRLPMSDMVLYEFSRATPRDEWPAPFRTGARGLRGLSFLEAKYHYAAEEELTAYLAEVEAQPESDFVLTHRWGREALQTREGMRAIGHFARAWNRMQLKREEPATEDVEKGLESLEKLGVENELTWWGWALVHSRRGRYPEAAASLDKLASSPFLEEPMREELKASAEELRAHGEALPVLKQQRAMLILMQALVARAGGLEKLLTDVLGEETAKQVYEPLVWLERTRRGLEEVKAEDLTREAEGVLDEARGVGSRGWALLKEKLGLK